MLLASEIANGRQSSIIKTKQQEIQQQIELILPSVTGNVLSTLWILQCSREDEAKHNSFNAEGLRKENQAHRNNSNVLAQTVITEELTKAEQAKHPTASEWKGQKPNICCNCSIK